MSATSAQADPAGRSLSWMSRTASNLIRTPAFFLATAFFGSLSLTSSLFEKEGQVQHKIARVWARTTLWMVGAGVTVVGRENIRLPGVYASNHTSFMDTPLVFSSLPFQFRILAKQSLWKWPFIGWHLNRSGQIPVDEDKPGSIAGLNQAIKAVKSGMPLFIFPEGGRTADGALKTFMNGPAYIAIRARVPLVPIALVGAFELLPMHSHHFCPGAVKLVIGPAIDCSAYTIRQVEEVTARLRHEIEQLWMAHRGHDSDKELGGIAMHDEAGKKVATRG